MRLTRPLVAALLLTTVWASGPVMGQITANPIPEPITKKGLAVEIRDVVRLPQTRGMRPANQDTNPAGYARVSYVRHAPDGRLFANDSRGFLYILNGSNPPQVYANLAEIFPRTV